MTTVKSLVNKIRVAFADVPFPFHCGLHAAVAMDDWVFDEVVLCEITRRDDFIGAWWDVPLVHLQNCMKALSYLDSAGIDFYLPAYMVALLEVPSEFDEPMVKSSSWQIIYTMLREEDEPDLKEYFNERFSKIIGDKKSISREFLRFVEGADFYSEHSREIAREALTNEFWLTT